MDLGLEYHLGRLVEVTVDPHFGRFTRVRLVGGELLVLLPTPDDAGAWYDADLNRTVSLRQALNDAKRRAIDLTGPFLAFRELWYALTREVFANEGAVEGAAPWPELSPAYHAQKHAEGSPYRGLPILQRTKRLLESLLGGAQGVYEARPRSLQYGSRVPYFEMHMEGTDNMPPRPPIILTRAAFGELNRLVMSSIAGKDLRRG